jgi:hypothetical protein
MSYLRPDHEEFLPDEIRYLQPALPVVPADAAAAPATRTGSSGSSSPRWRAVRNSHKEHSPDDPL